MAITAAMLPIILISCHLISSCGLDSHTDFYKYIRAFEEAADTQNRPQIVIGVFEFSDRALELIECSYYDGEITAKVNKDEWDLLTEGQKEFAVFRSLGGCHMGQGPRHHVLSYMNPYIPGPDFYERWRGRMVKELFSFPYN